MLLYKEAEEYVEALLKARKSIVEAVKNARAQQRAERLEFLMRTNTFDPTADAVTKDLSPLPLVYCCHLGQTFLVYKPEKWLKVMKEAFLLYRQRFPSNAYTTIQHRYIWEWEIRKIIARENISKMTYQNRRSDFLQGALVLAAQAGLIEIDANMDILKERAEVASKKLSEFEKQE